MEVAGRNSDEPNSISDLPDDIIGRILSCLSTKEAVRTSVLSRNWEYKWTYAENISIIGHRFTDHVTDNDEALRRSDRRAAFVRFMDKVVLLTEKSRIVNFTFVNCDLNPHFNQLKLKTWIGALLMRRNIQNLRICIPRREESIELPPCFSSSSSFEKLELRFGGVWKVPANNCFDRLKSLCLGEDPYNPTAIGYVSEFEIRNEQGTDRISLTFPVLEKLYLGSCKVTGVECVEIRAPGLIKYRAAFISGVHEIKICGSNLSEFRMTGVDTPNYVFDGHPVISCVELDLYHISSPAQETMSRILAILKQSPNLNCLSLSDQDVEALAETGLGFPTLHQLKVLQFRFTWDHPPYQDILKFLQLLPSIETLSMCMVGYATCFHHIQDQDVALCTLPYLKEFEFIKFTGSDCQVGLVGSILKNVNLKRMLVKVEERTCTTTIKDQLSKLVPTTSSCVLVVEKYPRSYCSGRNTSFDS